MNLKSILDPNGWLKFFRKKSVGTPASDDMDTYLSTLGCTISPVVGVQSNPSVAIFTQNAEEFKTYMKFYHVIAYTPVCVIKRSMGNNSWSYTAIGLGFGMSTTV